MKKLLSFVTNRVSIGGTHMNHCNNMSGGASNATTTTTSTTVNRVQLIPIHDDILFHHYEYNNNNNNTYTKFCANHHHNQTFEHEQVHEYIQIINDIRDTITADYFQVRKILMVNCTSTILPESSFDIDSSGHTTMDESSHGNSRSNSMASMYYASAAAAQINEQPSIHLIQLQQLMDMNHVYMEQLHVLYQLCHEIYTLHQSLLVLEPSVEEAATTESDDERLSSEQVMIVFFSTSSNNNSNTNHNNHRSSQQQQQQQHQWVNHHSCLTNTLLLMSCYMEYANGHLVTSMDACLNMIGQLPKLMKWNFYNHNNNNNNSNNSSGGGSGGGSHSYTSALQQMIGSGSSWQQVQQQQVQEEEERAEEVTLLNTEQTSSHQQQKNDHTTNTVNTANTTNTTNTTTTTSNELMNGVIMMNNHTGIENQPSMMRLCKFFSHLLQDPLPDITPVQLSHLQWTFSQSHGSDGTHSGSHKDQMMTMMINHGHFVYFIKCNDTIIYCSSPHNQYSVPLDNSMVMGDFCLFCYWVLDDEFHKVFRLSFNTMFLSSATASSSSSSSSCSTLVLNSQQLDWIHNHRHALPFQYLFQDLKNIQIQLHYRPMPQLTTINHAFTTHNNLQKSSVAPPPLPFAYLNDAKKYREHLEYHISQSPFYYINENNGNSVHKYRTTEHYGIATTNAQHTNNKIVPSTHQMRGMNRVMQELENKIKRTLKKAQDKYLIPLQSSTTSLYYGNNEHRDTNGSVTMTFDSPMSVDTNSTRINSSTVMNQSQLLFTIDQASPNMSMTHSRIRHLKSSARKSNSNTPSSELARRLKLSVGSNSAVRSPSSVGQKRRRDSIDDGQVNKLLDFSFADDMEAPNHKNIKDEQQGLLLDFSDPSPSDELAHKSNNNKTNNSDSLLLDMSMDVTDQSTNVVNPSQPPPPPPMNLPPPPPPPAPPLNMPPMPPSMSGLLSSKSSSTAPVHHVPLKRLHWAPLRNNELTQSKHSVWKNVSHVQLPSMTEFESLFSRQATNIPSAASTASSKKNHSNAVDKVTASNSTDVATTSAQNKVEKSDVEQMTPIVSAQQARNVEIVISSQFRSLVDMKASDIDTRFSKLKRAIESFDTDILDHSKLCNLHGFMTTIMTSDIIDAFDKIPSDRAKFLPQAEQFLYVLNTINRVADRLQTMKYIHTWHSVYETLVARVSCKLSTCELLVQDDLLLNKIVLPYILVMGNTMNRDTGARLGSASGFNLDVLPKLADTKAQCHIMALPKKDTDSMTDIEEESVTSSIVQNSSFTLMHYLAHVLESFADTSFQEGSDINCSMDEESSVLPSEFYKQLDKPVEQCMKITTTTILSLLSELNRHVHHFESELKFVSSDSSAYSKLENICKISSSQLQSVTDIVEKYKSTYDYMLEYYHFKNASENSSSNREESNSGSIDEVFGILYKFVSSYKAAYFDNQDLRNKQQEKKRIMARLAKKRRLD